MKYRINAAAGLAAAIALAGCAASADEAPVAIRTAPLAQDSEPSRVTGAPYQVDGTTYTPADVRSYDDVGYAMVGDAPVDGLTTLGEPYRADYIAGGHKTLPLPTYVEVSDIATGRTILVRINQRGPMRGDRLISLTPAAAAQLGMAPDRPTGVRVRKVNPSTSERDVLRSGGKAIERLPTSKSLLAVLQRKLGELGVAPVVPVAPAPTPAPAPAKATPVKVEPVALAPPATKPVAAPQPAAGTAGHYVQIAAFKSRASADALARKAGAKVYQGPGVWRVRFGPYASEAEARNSLADVRAKGYPKAVTVHER